MTNKLTTAYSASAPIMIIVNSFERDDTIIVSFSEIVVNLRVTLSYHFFEKNTTGVL